VDAVLQEKVFERITIRPKTFIGYSVSCTGTQFCNLALVETKERMRRIAEYLDDHLEIDVPVRIHMVGCPNSCGQRQIGDIGLQGIKMKTKDKGMVEAFEIYVGGTLRNGGKFNEKLKGKIDAEQLHEVLLNLLTYFKETKQPGETFLEYVNRIGLEQLQTKLDNILNQLNTVA
jgi:ferredoxin-nitrite reductase